MHGQLGNNVAYAFKGISDPLHLIICGAPFAHRPSSLVVPETYVRGNSCPVNCGLLLPTCSPRNNQAGRRLK
jgi:hypothetical protein